MAHTPRADLSSDPSAELGGFASRAPGGETRESLDRVVDVALTMFAKEGFANTKLDDISRQSGMSKRMIHYHFVDKKALYRRALTHAMQRITPPADVLNRSHAVPVEGMRRFIDAIFYRFQDNTDAVALMLRENLDPVLDQSETAALNGHSDVVLHMERLLLLGQDSGAFRPGISAEDVLLLVSSVCEFRISSHKASLALGHIKLTNQRNTEGLRRMTIDMVLGFLTSNIPDSGYASYLEAAATPAQPSTAPSDSYGIEEPELY
ncbi:TetR/AcrR family transcriptional regulator [Corynebacterium sanguinis]|uniref:TetR family transcriptional regulator n=1 Tax=Corynebacterium sanguinis TaxID=2594913 RepID=A0A838X5K1_9CORY|nr:TetR/AcrR family transcriptional regulator [Corynebacterium sanguinis]MBA4506067.1 TetR family transcriptional regulator [Corynebacterium sanguinis]MCT1583944.1 TetR family transcriptional regulator [Corynebacterium sanguinis]MCT1663249.1 TetR family transcriptional regulator [Corynebacterium sanguinis]MCT2023054.1 TetR family transcriptional regulator [Corynebacterium sanguinis]MCT2046404.1 TetR family transcriptional regulator [Corynebacterium sanguinis]